MIRIEKIRYHYNDKYLFNGLDLSISRGSYVSFVGPNGSGKTTLAMLIKGFIAPESGKVFFENRDVTGAGLNNRVGYIFSNPENQIVSSLVSEDVAFGPENQGKYGEELKIIVSKAVGESNISALVDKLTHKLSGGEQQKVAVAGLLAMDVDLIIFDEAASMIDPIGKREFLGLLEKMVRKEGVTVIHITHSLEDILKSERVVALNEGSIVFDGPPCDIIENSDVLKTLGWSDNDLPAFVKGLIERHMLSGGIVCSPENIAEFLIESYGRKN